MKTRSARCKKWQETFDASLCVTDKHLERLKVRVTNYQIGGVDPLSQHQKAEKSIFNGKIQ